MGVTREEMGARGLAPYSVLVCKETNNLRGGMQGQQDKGQKNQKEQKSLLSSTNKNSLSDESLMELNESQEYRPQSAYLNRSTAQLMQKNLLKTLLQKEEITT